MRGFFSSFGRKSSNDLQHFHVHDRPRVKIDPLLDQILGDMHDGHPGSGFGERLPEGKSPRRMGSDSSFLQYNSQSTAISGADCPDSGCGLRRAERTCGE